MKHLLLLLGLLTAGPVAMADHWEPVADFPGGGRRTAVDTVTAIGQLEVHQGIVVYPNPASDRLTVQLDAGLSQRVTFEVCDVTGRVVRQFEFAPTRLGVNRYELNVSGLTAGSYLVRVNDSQSRRTFKFVKF
ncbi:MAG TPA: T9SS type A sorting domain-containing protein [Chitinophagales bacterium]|nr:T9SS type A sorting domain-containing protein [Chitinophagales bacterium]